MLLRWWRAPCPRIGRPLRPTAAALRTRPAVALPTLPAVDLPTRPGEELRPATTRLGTASPGGADVVRLPAVAAAVLQGAMAVVVAAANPVEVAAGLRAQPGVMLALWVVLVDIAAVAVVAAAAAAASAAVTVAVVATVAAAAVGAAAAAVGAAAAAVAAAAAAAAASAAAVVVGSAARLW